MTEDILSRIKEPTQRREIMERIDKRVAEMYNASAEQESADVLATLHLSGITFLRFQVLMIFLMEIIGLTEEESINYIFNVGIEVEIEKMTATRNSILNLVGIPDGSSK